MSISFASWHRAERLKYKANLRTIGYDARLKPTRWRRLHRWWRAVQLLGFAVIAGFAIASAADRLEHQPTERQHAAPARPQVLRATSAATVVDGDTFKLGRETIRLHGIDAPESQQRCVDGWQAGVTARHALADLLAVGTPRCEKVTTDRHGRTVAICRVDGQDIGATMVRSGNAWAYTTYSLRYIPDEVLARAKRVGVHARTCMRPTEWRASHLR